MENKHNAAPITNVVIAGGGFGGVKLAQRLLKSKNHHITLIDRNNYNYFPPLLYQVSTGFLEPSSISYPFRKLFRHERFSFRMAEIIRVDHQAKKLHLNNGEIAYDELVFATGAKTNFFGMNSIQRLATPMKTIDDALRMRNALFRTLEQAAITRDHSERKKLLTIVVAGGGATGVEVTGMLAEIRKHIVSREYPELKGICGDIYIVDGGQNLLGPMSEKTHQETYRILSGLGVNIIFHTHVTDFDGELVSLSSGQNIKAKTLIWAAGITANTFEGIPETSLGPGRRMITNEFSQVTGLEHIYAIGDGSIELLCPAFPKGHPQLAQVALQQGICLAKNLVAVHDGMPLLPFVYHDKGEMAVIGRNHAAVDLFRHRFHLSGPSALLIWLVIHLVSLINYSNRLRTLFNWVIAYLSKDQSLRMIFRAGDIAEVVPLKTQNDK